MSKNIHAVALGRKGGKVKSEAKSKAARENWKKAIKKIKIVTPLILALFLSSCEHSKSRIFGENAPHDGGDSSVAEFFTVACCQDNNAGVMSYPSFLPQSHIDFCERASQAVRNNELINGDVYLPMHVDCGHGHQTIGDNFYPSSGY